MAGVHGAGLSVLDGSTNYKVSNSGILISRAAIGYQSVLVDALWDKQIRT